MFTYNSLVIAVLSTKSVLTRQTYELSGLYYYNEFTRILLCDVGNYIIGQSVDIKPNNNNNNSNSNNNNNNKKQQ